MEQSPFWEADRSSAGQETSCILWYLKVYYRSHRRSPPVPILSQVNPVHASQSYFLKIHFNIILLSVSWSFKWSLSFRFPHQNPVHPSPPPDTCYVHHLSHYSWFDHQNNSLWGVQSMKLLSVELAPVSCCLIPLKLKYLPQNSIFKHLMHVLKCDEGLFFWGGRG